MKRGQRDVPGFRRGPIDEVVAGAAEGTGMMVRQVPRQQRQQLDRRGMGFRQRREDIGMARLQQNVLGGEVGGKAVVDLDPFG